MTIKACKITQFHNVNMLHNVIYFLHEKKQIMHYAVFPLIKLHLMTVIDINMPPALPQEKEPYNVHIIKLLVLVWFDTLPVNSYGHVGMVSSPNNTFFLGKLDLAIYQYFVHILSLPFLNQRKGGEWP